MLTFFGMHEEVVTYLEMTSPNALVPPTRATAWPLMTDLVTPDDSGLVRDTYVRIGRPLNWDSPRMSWSADDWLAEIFRPGVHAWLGRVDGETAGLVELEAGPNDDVGIVVFGLVPEFIGKGFGAAFLTQSTRLAWDFPLVGGQPVRRVWVQTWRDHPHAIPNYQSRGFRIFRTERRTAGSE